jgi:hypothetical protein
MPNDLTFPTGSWLAETAELAAVLERPVWSELPELGVIEASGDDAVSFLQTQLTNSVDTLDDSRIQLNGYCTAKGRLLAVFDNWRRGTRVYLQLPREILPSILKRIGMFVLRSKVKLADASAQWLAFGLAGPGAAALLESAGVAAPDQGAVAVGDARVARQPAGARVAERFLIVCPAAERAQWEARFKAALKVGPGVWWWTQIDAGVPSVFAVTQERFVPQMINLEVLGGVSFKKGCYPGQEVVARSQYLGKLRRRMSAAHTEGGAVAGADLFDAGGQPVGTIVMTASAPSGGTDLLFECPSEKLETGVLHAGSADGPALQVRPLPYALFDPTA